MDRQGIRYLEQNGVKVHLFDLDLQARIREVNKEFIAQALKRAAEAKDGKKRANRRHFRSGTRRWRA